MLQGAGCCGGVGARHCPGPSPQRAFSVGLWLASGYPACRVGGETEARRDVGAGAAPLRPCAVRPGQATAPLRVCWASPPPRTLAGLLPAQHAACSLLSARSCSLLHAFPLCTSRPAARPPLPAASPVPGAGGVNRRRLGEISPAWGPPQLGSSSSPQPPRPPIIRPKHVGSRLPRLRLARFAGVSTISQPLLWQPRRGEAVEEPPGPALPTWGWGAAWGGGGGAGSWCPPPPDRCQEPALPLGSFLPAPPPSFCLEDLPGFPCPQVHMEKLRHKRCQAGGRPHPSPAGPGGGGLPSGAGECRTPGSAPQHLAAQHQCILPRARSPQYPCGQGGPPARCRMCAGWVQFWEQDECRTG